ncbi:hypothetical protein D3C78_1035020 [compost metagenome]
MINYPVAEVIHSDLSVSDILLGLLPVCRVDIFLQVTFFIKGFQDSHRFSITVIHSERSFTIQCGVREAVVVFNNSWQVVHYRLKRPFILEVGSEWDNAALLQLLACCKEFVPGFRGFCNACVSKCFFVIHDTRSRVPCSDSVQLAIVGFEIFEGDLTAEFDIIQRCIIFRQIRVWNIRNIHQVRKLATGDTNFSLLVVIGLTTLEFNFDIRIFFIKAL